MNLRAAHVLDTGAVGAILSGFIDEMAWMPRLYTGAETIGFAGTMIDRNWVQVAEDEGAIQGFIARDSSFVHALYVAQSARWGGVGSMLVKAAQRKVDRLELWTFQANGPAQVFYGAHGFREVRRTDGAGNDEGLPDIEMVWDRKVR